MKRYMSPKYDDHLFKVTLTFDCYYFFVGTSVGTLQNGILAKHSFSATYVRDSISPLETKGLIRIEAMLSFAVKSTEAALSRIIPPAPT